MSQSSLVTVTDLFCGAGGSSLGAAQSGAEIRMALNHWELAVQTHNTNFPNTDHHCCDASQADPRYYPRTTVLIASPELMTALPELRGKVLLCWCCPDEGFPEGREICHGQVLARLCEEREG